MLTLYRRHSDKCPRAKKVAKLTGERQGRSVLGCNCVIWVEGKLDGKYIRCSMKTRDMTRARRKLTSWSEPPKSNENVKHVRDAIEDFNEENRHLALSTQRKYRNVMRKLAEHCERKRIITMPEFTLEVLRSYRNSRAISPLTAKKELETLRKFWAFCLESRWVTENIAKRVACPKNIKPKEVIPYTRDEVAAILAACGELQSDYGRRRATAMILLMRFAALRISDTTLLSRDRVRDGMIHLHTEKTGGVVLLPLPQAVIDVLDALPVPRGAPCPSRFFFWNGVSTKRTAIGMRSTCCRVCSRRRASGARAPTASVIPWRPTCW